MAEEKIIQTQASTVQSTGRQCDKHACHAHYTVYTLIGHLVKKNNKNKSK